MMNRLALAAVFFAVRVGDGYAANPVMSGADPHVIVVGDQYWLYPTINDSRREIFKAFSSPDLKTWTDHGVILDFAGIEWIAADGRDRHGAWAPGVLAAGGKYYLYFSVGPQDATHPSRIGVAISDTPDGPFKDSGRALVIGGQGFEAIDPMAFTDPKSNVTYLLAGGSAGAKLRVWELTPDFIGLKREVDVRTPPEFTEGAFLHERSGTYYLSYSHGRYNDSSYSVHYATAPSPTGPWSYRGAILTSDSVHKGPGHHSFVVNPKSGETFIVYHRYDTVETKGPYNKLRRHVAIDRVDYDAKGLIKPIKMTDADAPVSPLK